MVVHLGRPAVRVGVALGLATVIVSGCASRSARTGEQGSVSPPSPPSQSSSSGGVTGDDSAHWIAGSGDLHDYVLHDGDTARAVGMVIADPGSPTLFCAPVSMIEGGAFNACGGAHIDAVGVDTNLLTDRETQDGAVRGYADLTGTYSGGTLTVTEQRVPDSERTPIDETPPCPTPPGGWPGHSSGQPSMAAVETYAHEHPGTVVEKAYLNPPPGRTLVYVLTTEDPATVTAALSPAYDGDVCVARSRYTTEDLAHARAVMCNLMPRSGRPALTDPTSACGIGLGPDQQVDTAADIAVISADEAAAIDALPAGLVQVSVWLAPVPH